METPTLLLILPGLDGTGKRLGDFVAALAPDIDARILAYPVDQPLDYAGLESLLAPLLPRDRPYAILAESFAGPLAIRIAAHRPPQLRALILCGSFIRSPFPRLGWAAPWLSHFPVKSLPRWLRTLLMWNSQSRMRTPAEAARATAAVAAPVLRKRIEALLTVDERERCRDLAVPVLMIRGRRDRVVGRTSLDATMRALPEAHLIEVEGPHLLLQTVPGSCAAAVRQFLRERCP